MVVCFTLTNLPNPRMNKRIAFFKEFAEVHVVCTRRSRQNLWEPTQDVDHRIYNIDLPDSKHLIKRMMCFRNFQKRVLQEIDDIKPDVIYAAGLDMLMIAAKYKAKYSVKIVFEVADLRECFFAKKRISDIPMSWLIQKKERELFRYVDCLVVTSPKFYDIHYKALIPRDKVVFIANAPNLESFKSYKKKEDGIFTIGFIGGIRYFKQLKLLVDSAEALKIKVFFAGGAGMLSPEYDDFMSYCKGKDFIEFFGRYDYDKDIADLYGKVDCVYAVYDADNLNVRIALPNKLYESVYCELPLIVAQNTYLEELVTQWGVGVSVDHKEKTSLIESLSRLVSKGEEYQNIVNNCKKMKECILSEGEKDKAILDIIEKKQ